MRTLFVMDPLDRIQVAGDSTYALMLEARRRGWPVWCCEPADLYALDGHARALASAVEVTEAPPHFAPSPPEDRALGEFDVVWMRKDPPFDMTYVFTTFLLDLVPPETLVLNAPSGLRSANEKMYALQWPELCPPSLVTRDIRKAVARVRAEPGRSVLKPWDGNGGRGVMVTDGADGNLRAMLEVLTDEGRRHVIVQRYVPEIAQGDKRIVLVDGLPLGWMLRVPQPGDHRGNMHVGARVAACELTPRDRAICDDIGPRLKADGLLFVGIDVIGDWLTEVNVTSPTGIWEIHRLGGRRLERDITDAVVARYGRRRAGVAP